MAPNVAGKLALPCCALAYTPFKVVPGHVPLTMPCWSVFDPVMYPIQYCVLAFSAGQPFPAREMLFHPALTLTVVVPV